MVVLITVLPYARARWVCILSLIGMATFYQYKESIQTAKRYLTYSKFVKVAAIIVLTNIAFGLFILALVNF